MGASQSSENSKNSANVDRSDLNASSEKTSLATLTEVYPIPKGDEYDAIDKIAAELPNIIDDESRQQVEDYKHACDNGKGPMVRDFIKSFC